MAKKEKCKKCGGTYEEYTRNGSQVATCQKCGDFKEVAEVTPEVEATPEVAEVEELVEE